MGRPESQSNRRKMFRWNHVRDLTLITEVEACQPFLVNGKEEKLAWTKICETINQTYSGNTDCISVKNRFKLLLSNFKREDFKNRYKSGTEEDVTSIVDKLATIASLIDDAKIESVQEEEQKAKKITDEKALGEEVRGAALTSMKRKSPVADFETSTPKRATEKSLSEMWYDKQETDRRLAEDRQKMEQDRHIHDVEQREKDRELRLREVEVKERQLDLDRKNMEHRHEMEKEDQRLQRERFEVEKEERFAMLNTQKMMLEMLKKSN